MSSSSVSSSSGLKGFSCVKVCGGVDGGDGCGDDGGGVVGGGGCGDDGGGDVGGGGGGDDGGGGGGDGRMEGSRDLVTAGVTS